LLAAAAAEQVDMVAVVAVVVLFTPSIFRFPEQSGLQWVVVVLVAPQQFMEQVVLILDYLQMVKRLLDQQELLLRAAALVISINGARLTSL
jgi:hypothetical protein